jgi:signal transduction histidine kinase
VSGESPTDRTPALAQLIKREDLERCLGGFLSWGGIDGVMLFDQTGVRYGGAATEESPLSRWDQLPAEAQAAAGGEVTSFGLEGHRFEVRAAYAGADRVGVAVFSARADGVPGSGVEDLADAVTGVVGQLLQAGFATWVTSELHLALSESSYLAVQNQNTELQRAVEHLRELDKLKSNFLATVSHELRTPLTSVIGFSEMMLEGLAGDLSREQTEYVRTIRERGEELLTLITQILEMSRLEVGSIRLALAPRDVGDVVTRAISAVEFNARKAGVELANEVDDETLPKVLIDGDKVHQVLVNLMSNAVKFTRNGGSVAVSANRAPIRRPYEEETLFGAEADDAVMIVVRDTGVGIPEEQLERIFEPFYQVDQSPTREHGGAGLGLSIVKSLVTAHGGEVWAESSPPAGTTFFFTLPVLSEAGEQAPVHWQDGASAASLVLQGERGTDD